MVRRFMTILVLVLLVSLLAACGQTETGAQPTQDTSSGGAAQQPTEAAGETGKATSDTPTQPTDADATAQPTVGATNGGGQVPDLGGRTLIVGSDTTYPPMESLNEQTGEIEGFDVDMMRAMGELLNANFEFQTFPSFDAIFAALNQRQFDLVVSSVSVTEERKQIIDFSDPYLSVGQAIATQTNNTTINSVEDLQNVSLIGVQGGTTGEQAVKNAGIPEEKIRRYDTIDLAFQDLANGAIDAVVADGPPVARYTAQFENLKVVGEPFTTEDYAIALQKGDEELRTAINAGLAELKRNGTLEQLLEKWKLVGAAKLPE